MAEETRDGLVRRQITTRKGARVWRWVKPPVAADVVIEAPVEMPEAPLADTVKDRAVRRAAAPKPVPEPVVEKPKKRLFATIGYGGCCGAVVVFPKPEPEAKGELTEEEMRSAYEKTHMYRSYLSYPDLIKQCDEFLEGAKVKKIPLKNRFEPYSPDSRYRYGYTWPQAIAEIEINKRAYEANMKNYSFETYKIKGDVTASGLNNYNWRPEVPRGRGVAIGDTEFPGSFETPGGLFARGDHFNGHADTVPGRIEPVQAVAQPAVMDVAVSAACTKYESKSDKHIVYYMNGSYRSPGGLWKTIKNDKLKEGQVVTFIFNRNQMTSDERMKIWADAGFQCILITGNTNHGNSSKLYLFERKLTAVDIEQLHGQ